MILDKICSMKKKSWFSFSKCVHFLISYQHLSHAVKTKLIFLFNSHDINVLCLHGFAQVGLFRFTFSKPGCTIYFSEKRRMTLTVWPRIPTSKFFDCSNILPITSNQTALVTMNLNWQLLQRATFCLTLRHFSQDKQQFHAFHFKFVDVRADLDSIANLATVLLTRKFKTLQLAYLNST